MSTTVEANSRTPWRKRAREDDNSVPLELKRPRVYYFRLESESSRASENDTESICSEQDKDTDVVRDTSDTESQASEYEVEIEYEVASASEGDDNKSVISSTDSEGLVISAVAAAFMQYDKSLEAWITDVEDSDSSLDETSFGRTDFSTCVQCNGENNNPCYRYCEKCFQARKRFFPPRPRRKKRSKKDKKADEDPVKLHNLQTCLSGLSQDSGIGSSQECPLLDLDQIIVPEHLNTTGMCDSTKESETLCMDSLKEGKSEFKASEIQSEESKMNSHVLSSKVSRKRQISESSLSECEVKRPRVTNPSKKRGKSLSAVSEVDSTSACFASNASEAPTQSESSELCLFCNNAPKDSIFLHTNMAHRCCCYKCAKKTLKTTRRCPICNRSVNKVLRIFTS